MDQRSDRGGSLLSRLSEADLILRAGGRILDAGWKVSRQRRVNVRITVYDFSPRSLGWSFCGLSLLLIVSICSATEIQLIVDRPVDLSPSSSTSPVTLRFTATATDSCSTTGTCRTRSAVALQIAPCPPNATSCVGSYAIYFQNRDSVSNFTPMRFELVAGTVYTVTGEWTLEQWLDSGGACTQLRCNHTQSFSRTFAIADLVGTHRSSWTAIKAKW